MNVYHTSMPLTSNTGYQLLHTLSSKTWGFFSSKAKKESQYLEWFSAYCECSSHESEETIHKGGGDLIPRGVALSNNYCIPNCMMCVYLYIHWYTGISMILVFVKIFEPTHLFILEAFRSSLFFHKYYLCTRKSSVGCDRKRDSFGTVRDF